MNTPSPFFPTAGKLKVIGACVLLLCFVLPLKSCSEYRDATGARISASVATGESPPPGAHKVTTRYYLTQELVADQPLTWLQVASFVFPLAAVVYVRFRPTRRFTKVLWFLEPLLLLAVVASLELALVLYSADIGAYVARVAVLIYFIGWLIEARDRWRARRLRLAAPAPS